MGLFDTLRCEYPLPDPAHQDLEYQTKDLDPAMLEYTITRDGRLLRHPAGPFAKLAKGPIEVQHHGDVCFYTSAGESKEWVEYVARFTNGRLEWIRRHRRAERPAAAAPRGEPQGTAASADEVSSPSPPAQLPGESERRDAERRLLATLAERAAELEALLASSSDHWGFEDPIYRFYHQSYKVFWLQEQTKAIVAVLESLAPDRPLNSWFQNIIAAGTGKRFSLRHNNEWTVSTRPIVEAFFHARFFLEMAVRYARVEKPSDLLPSGYAALLTLYGLR